MEPAAEAGEELVAPLGGAAARRLYVLQRHLAAREEEPTALTLCHASAALGAHRGRAFADSPFCPGLSAQRSATRCSAPEARVSVACAAQAWASAPRRAAARACSP